MTEKRIAQIDQHIGKIKAALAGLAEMRPGSLTRQFKDPEAGTGAYYQLSFTLEMKSRTDYIPRQCVAQVRRQVANYKRFKALSAQWVALGIERSRLQIKLTRIV
ncbi:MAG: DUF6788 family protein [Steroidobacteraceae bacterium]|jgi:hypothetical protein